MLTDSCCPIRKNASLRTIMFDSMMWDSQCHGRRSFLNAIRLMDHRNDFALPTYLKHRKRLQ